MLTRPVVRPNIPSTAPSPACSVAAVQDLPAGFDETELSFALLEGWGITVNSLDYVTLGFGSYPPARR